ncbi:oxoglutarate dehydrogenase (succinyl-transferring), E1 component [Allomyces macrogynus ATCC 38327]|uniref:2-oxoglutarate dehydrogenase, mitochondrial n=1 Tax=Allomyces macrogynus (strain ATCC 38327) TaxID=578462 RepID=A0A0L0SKT5_ALLM3|nr:oxoglutarate dehydrogenase (succinyl-transferring), E1 component [Allomyces macrogynus ATCC 38327]|eukprot:KNE63048.1 oxoglutarate dehydrogenase (succinyl-transferring), E1 component [Allomyces macrogynus ATCC 38327]
MSSRLLQASSTAALAAARTSLRRQAVPALASASTAGRVLARKYATANNEAFLAGNAANYVDEMYAAWRKDPTSVHVSWQAYFANVERGAAPGAAYTAPPSLAPNAGATAAMDSVEVPVLPTNASSPGEIVDHLKVQLLARAYQVRGHHLAKLDPLGIHNPESQGNPPELEPSYYGFSEADFDRKFALGPGMLPGYRTSSPQLTLREIVQTLQATYCGTIGIEYAHIPDRGQCDWLRERIEVPNRVAFSREDKHMILDRLIWSDSFERFVATKFPSEKRFGLEGCEALIPGMKALIDRSVDLGVESIVMGMPHRGRLNVLSNVVRKPNESIFCEFSGTVEPNMAEGSGDVKYHLGMNYDRPTPSGKRVHLSLVANPSHLEAVNPVVEGKTRAIQFYAGDNERSKAMPVLLHGDAAFAGQGIVYETLGFADLPQYATGGTVHIIVNNQIGFTTDPRFSRSTPYCSDVAKTVGAPILHVNGDDVEAVVYACKLAGEWRQKFKKDVVVDIVCYRRHGHNEIDQPMFTQPRMYQIINKQKPVLETYIEQLLAEGTFTAAEIEAMKQRVWTMLEESYTQSKDYQPTPKDWVSSSWHGFMSPKELASLTVAPRDTGLDRDLLRQIGTKVSTIPETFTPHSLIKRIIGQRLKTVEEGEGLDWATAEAIAFGSLLMERTHLRLSGQDVERGTFSQRHAVLHDQQTEQTFTALNHLSPDQAKFTVSNSSLSEYGVLGFELGYSLVSPNSLVIWEAQFGDFANNAQCIIDQFIASGEKKWLQRTGLVLSLPHGYDGQGPEHSSSRIERFLQLCDEDPYKFPTPEELARQHQDCNMQVCYPSTPANYFHVLRRQVHRDFRKPLIMPFSKSLLRHPLARSSLADMGPGTRFQRFLPEVAPESLLPPEDIKTVLLCSGQVYYALARAREVNQIKDVVIGRVEQISPFPFDKVQQFVDQYPNAVVRWVQEEPMNMGPWPFVAPRIQTAMRHSQHHGLVAQRERVEQDPSLVERLTPHGQPLSAPVLYAGRAPSGAVATGNKKQHLKEERALISEALFGEIRPVASVESGVPVYQV